SMHEHHLRKMDYYEDIIPYFEQDYKETCTYKQVPPALLKKHYSSISFLLGDFCKPQVKSPQQD
ncbi:hypothetical protein, partial [Shewanella schlegeliana]|uniref:hypothetical protein n=1 Tax=Shewanella schlegeliana TaxID=190308 RepID=UPI001C7CC3C3